MKSTEPGSADLFGSLTATSDGAVPPGHGAAQSNGGAGLPSHGAAPLSGGLGDWAPFQGGELEGVPPRRRCRSCREAGLDRQPSPQVICFGCYRAELEHERRLNAARQLDTASDVRFQWIGPLDPVNDARLQALKASRAVARAAARTPWSERRMEALRVARRALADSPAAPSARVITVHGQPLPAAWLPFVRENERCQQVG